jgi:hypothetical protein
METDTLETAEAPTGLDIDAASDQIASSIFPESEAPESVDEAPIPDVKTVEPPVQTAEPIAPDVQPEVSTAPKSWPKEMHAHWENVPKEVQTYWQTREKQMLDGLEQYKGAAQYGRTMQEAVHPFEHILKQQGLDAPRAVNALLGAQQRLTTGTLESRQAAYDELGRKLQLRVGQQQPGTEQPHIDPRLQTLEQRYQQIETTLQQQQQDLYQERLAKITQEVNAFASDPAHALFDECADDIMQLVQAGLPLQEAYDKAVWANPVTREKQVQLRIQTESEKARERARLDALPKDKARGVNVRSRETTRTPTEPLGTMEDTMKQTLVSFRNKSIH